MGTQSGASRWRRDVQARVGVPSTAASVTPRPWRLDGYLLTRRLQVPVLVRSETRKALELSRYMRPKRSHKSRRRVALSHRRTYALYMVEKAPFRAIGVHHMSVGHGIMLQVERHTQWVVGSVPFNLLLGAWSQLPWPVLKWATSIACSDDCRRHRRRHPSEHRIGTLNMGIWARSPSGVGLLGPRCYGTGLQTADRQSQRPKPCPRSLLEMPPPTPHAMGATVEHIESHTVSIRTH